MPPFPPQVTHELDGWTLFWAKLNLQTCAREAQRQMRNEAVRRARSRLALDTLASHPVIAKVRILFRAVGCDPTRYRPSSEALLRRVLKGDDLPELLPVVDLNNCLSLDLLVPACVMDAEALEPPFVLRRGQPGESMVSLRGLFDPRDKPLLVDMRGPFGTPITDSERVKVVEGTREVWLVAYLPTGVVSGVEAEACLRKLLAEAPVASLATTATTGG